VDRNIKIVGQLKLAFEPHRKMFKKLKAKWKQLSSQCFCKEKENTKKY